MRCTLLLGMLLTAAAFAQTAPEVLWVYDVPPPANAGPVYTGPDGTVYFITDRLNALTPAGTLRWTAPAGPSHVDVGPDGTIYTAGVHTVYAYNPDGSERWRFTEDPNNRGWGITTGPTLGPDGNLYAVTIQGGLGAFSLTPDGDLRWNVPGFLTDDGREHGEVAFGPNNLYYADTGLWLVEGCTTSPYTGLVSITLDGDVDWCRSISGVYDPPVGVQATLDGRALVIQNALPGIHVQAYAPSGEREWTQPFLPTNLGVGPDNHVYAWQGARLISMTASGQVRWSRIQPINNFPWRAVVAPDLQTLVSGSVYGFGENGTIVAVDPTDGQALWSLPVTGPSAGVAGPVAFSPDGSVAYVPVSTLSTAEPDQLWAVRVRSGSPVSAGAPPASGLALSAPAPSPTAGSAVVALTLGEAQSVRAAVYDALGRRVAVLHDGPLAAGTHDLALDASRLPPGVYAVRASGASLAATVRLTVAR